MVSSWCSRHLRAATRSSHSKQTASAGRGLSSSNRSSITKAFGRAVSIKAAKLLAAELAGTAFRHSLPQGENSSECAGISISYINLLALKTLHFSQLEV